MNREKIEVFSYKGRRWPRSAKPLLALVGAGVLCFVILLGLVLNNFPSLTLPFDYSILLTPLVIIWYIVSELGSILENSANMGAPIPGFLKRALEKVKVSCDSAAEDENKSGKVG